MITMILEQKDMYKLRGCFKKDFYNGFFNNSCFCYVGDFDMFCDNLFNFNYEDLLLKIEKNDINNINLSIILIINNDAVFIIFPNLDKVPDERFLIEKNYVLSGNKYLIYSIKEYIIKGIIE